jgi:hypothetical protein
VKYSSSPIKKYYIMRPGSPGCFSFALCRGWVSRCCTRPPLAALLVVFSFGGVGVWLVLSLGYIQTIAAAVAVFGVVIVLSRFE